VIPPGRYAVDTTPLEWDGEQLHRLKRGGIGRRPDRRRFWGYDGLLEAIKTDPVAAAAAFVRATGRCQRCGRTLKLEESKLRGLGPDCLAILAAQPDDQIEKFALALMNTLTADPTEEVAA